MLEPLAANQFPLTFMRAIFAVLLLCLAMSASAREWKNELFHCAANIPESRQEDLECGQTLLPINHKLDWHGVPIDTPLVEDHCPEKVRS